MVFKNLRLTRFLVGILALQLSVPLPLARANEAEGLAPLEAELGELVQAPAPFHTKDAEEPVEIDVNPKTLETAVAAQQEFIEQQNKALEPLILSYTTIIERAKRIEERFGVDELKARVERDEIRAWVPEFGLAELKRVDDGYFVRVVDQRTEVSYLIIDRSDAPQLVQKSKHLRQYISRQHIDAGNSRSDGKRGRDVVLVTLDHQELVSREESPKPSTWSRAYWKDYWLATKKRPTKQDVVLGVAMGVIQLGATYGMGWLAYQTGLSDHFDHFDRFVRPGISFAFGTGVGIGISTYKNWTKRPNYDIMNSKTFLEAKTISQKAKARLPLLSRAVKGSTIGFMYAISIAGAKRLGTVSFLPLLWETAKEVSANVFVNSVTKDNYYRISNVREYTRQNTDPFRVKVFPARWRHHLGPLKNTFLGRDLIELNRSNVENQMIQMIPFTLKFFDLTGVTSRHVQLGSFGITIPCLLIAAAPIMQYISLRYAEYLARSKASDPEMPLERVQELKEIAEGLRVRFDWLYKFGWVTSLKEKTIAGAEVTKNGVIDYARYCRFVMDF